MHNVFITELFDWPEREPGKRARWINRQLARMRIPLRLVPLNQTGVMTNVEQRMNMYHLVEQVLAYGVEGDLVELGSHTGQSAVLFQTLIERIDPARRLHVYDSFEGLPELAPQDGDTPFAAGQFTVGKEKLLANFGRYGLTEPVVHEGWFDATLPDGLPDKISFAHLDGDLYDSIKVSLEYVYPKLSRGAVCLVDDYCDPVVRNEYNFLPGVKIACDEFLADKPEEVSVLYAGGFGHGYFRKL
jgi:O-methyltransferase